VEKRQNNKETTITFKRDLPILRDVRLKIYKCIETSCCGGYVAAAA